MAVESQAEVDLMESIVETFIDSSPVTSSNVSIYEGLETARPDGPLYLPQNIALGDTCV